MERAKKKKKKAFGFARLSNILGPEKKVVKIHTVTVTMETNMRET